MCSGPLAEQALPADARGVTHGRIAPFPEPAAVYADRPAVDVVLPTCGDELAALDASWRTVRALRWAGSVTVHVIDDLDRPEVRRLAVHYGFRYHARAAIEGRQPGRLREGLSWAGELVIVVEPDVHNDRIAALNAAAGFRVLREVDLGHKTAALSVCTRDDFAGSRLGATTTVHGGAA